MKQFPDKEIAGLIIASTIDESLKMAIMANSNIKTMTYETILKLNDVE